MSAKHEVLGPCPFCGGAAEVEYYDEGGWCVGCGDSVGCAILDNTYTSEAEAIAAWNRSATGSTEYPQPGSPGYGDNLSPETEADHWAAQLDGVEGCEAAVAWHLRQAEEVRERLQGGEK